MAKISNPLFTQKKPGIDNRLGYTLQGASTLGGLGGIVGGMFTAGAGAGAAAGATGGATLGPVGAAIGAGVGALGGLIAGQLSKQDEEEPKPVAPPIENDSSALQRRMQAVQAPDRIKVLHDAMIAANDLPQQQRMQYGPPLMKGFMLEVEKYGKGTA